MANEKQGHLIGLYYSPENNPYNWTLIACLTDKSLNGTTETIDASSDCDAGNQRLLPGNKSWTIDMTGYIDFDPNGVVSSETLFDMWNGTSASDFSTGWFKLDDGDNYVRVGQGFISSFTEGGTSNELMTFSATISNSGGISDTELS